MRRELRNFLLLIMIVGSLSLVIFIYPKPESPPLKAIKVSGKDFALDDGEDSRFRFVGDFAFPILTDMIYAPILDYVFQQQVDYYLGSLPANVSVVRFFAYGENPQYNGASEPNWGRLDYLLQSCRNHQKYVIWVLYDPWDYTDSGTVPDYTFSFWNDTSVREVILDEITRYKEGYPEILGWELMNEGDLMARTDQDRTEIFNWVQNMSATIKASDSNHLISTGFSNEDLRLLHFYSDIPSFQIRLDWVTNIHNLSTIDFITFHAYGGNSDSQTTIAFFNDTFKLQISWYFDEMVSIHNNISKPVIVEEFGAQRQIGEPDRLGFYEYMFGEVLRTKINSMFNTWAKDVTPNSYSIYSYDPETNNILDAAGRIQYE